MINYAGYPFAPNSLFPDNGLANLAAVLRDTGKQVEILDLATVSVFSRFTSTQMTRRLARTWEALRPGADGGTGPIGKTCALLSLQGGEWARARRQSRVLSEIADDVVNRVRRDDIQAVGFKLWNGDGLQGSVAVARAIRRNCPNVRLFGGGPQVDTFMELLLQRYPVFDALAFGEGEETIRFLAEDGARDSSFQGIPNLLYRAGGKIERTEHRIVDDLDSLPEPVYDPHVYPAMRGDEKVKIIVVDESRGCRNNCAFCIHPAKSDRELRVKSIPKLIREVDNIEKRCNVHTFRFAGSCTPYSVLNEFASALNERGSRYMYASFAHVRHSEQADFKTIRDSGCVCLFFGVESGSQPVLNLMRKGTTTEQITRAIGSAREAGIFTVASIIYPAPGDNEQSRAETLKLLSGHAPDSVVVSPAVVVPRTDWFERPDRYGVTFRDRTRYLEVGMRWKAKLLLPPSFWGPLPLWVNGRSFKQALKATSAFAAALRAAGLRTAVSDEAYLMSERAGMDAEDFRDETRAAFFAGDAERVRSLVGRINANA